MSEAKRGCGYRKIWGLYLVSDPGFQLICDGLPLKLEPCYCCNFEPFFTRNLQRLQPQYITQLENKKHKDPPGAKTENKPCKCLADCPLCHVDSEGIYGLMFVGKQSYTPSTFIKEAFTMGVSKRIPKIPSWLKLGETWVLLAHLKTPWTSLEEIEKNELLRKEPQYERAIFYAFKPQRVEMPIWKGDLTSEEIQKLEQKGITPVLLDKTPDNMKKHKYATGIKKRLDKYLEPSSSKS